MTLAQKAADALKRACHCSIRKKRTSDHYHEAAQWTALEMAFWNQRNGHHYTREELQALRPVAALKRLEKGKPQQISAGPLFEVRA